jgi:hypothetical protein
MKLYFYNSTKIWMECIDGNENCQSDKHMQLRYQIYLCRVKHNWRVCCDSITALILPLWLHFCRCGLRCTSIFVFVSVVTFLVPTRELSHSFWQYDWICFGNMTALVLAIRLRLFWQYDCVCFGNITAFVLAIWLRLFWQYDCVCFGNMTAFVLAIWLR